MTPEEEEIVGFGGSLQPDTLIQAYQNGIFPWPMEGIPLPWFCPLERAILAAEDLHISRTLQRTERKLNPSFTIDQAFDEVIRACADSHRPGQKGTWITLEMIQAYTRLHRLGLAHSIEVWKDGMLIGGIYGVDAGGVFAGESMFYRVSGASKLAVIFLSEYLRSRGSLWMDIQVMTPHMESLGAKLIPRDVFLRELRRVQSQKLELF